MTRYMRRWFEMARLLITEVHTMGHKRIPKHLRAALKSHCEHFARLS